MKGCVETKAQGGKVWHDDGAAAKRTTDIQNGMASTGVSPSRFQSFGILVIQIHTHAQQNGSLPFIRELCLNVAALFLST